MFQKVTLVRASSDVVKQIKQAILSGEIEPGSKLPSQRELQNIFQVSRPIITESLRILEKMGLIEIKAGTQGGAIVSNTIQNRMGELFDLIVQLEEISIRELIEFREQVESCNARWAAERREDKDIIKLKNILNKMQLLIRNNKEWSTIIEQDSLFHLEIAKLANNKLSCIFLKLIWQNLIRIGVHHNLASMASEIYITLEKLVDAIEKKDKEQAYEIMKSHIHRFNEDLLKNYTK
jgi:GntR family transcriptional repressor for pyruvate dehydrogenase complex